MSRRDNRFDEDGNYLLPSEREDRVTFGAEEGNDDTDLAQQIKDAYPAADDLVHKSMLRAKKHASINAAAPFTTTNPVSILTGTLGGQLQVFTGPVVGGVVTRGSPAQTANWIGEDAETHPLTVTLAPVQQVDTGIVLPFGTRPFGIIQFGTRGMMVKAEVDIGTGCQFTVSGSSITVQVCLDGGGSAVPGEQASMILAGMVSAFYPIFRTTPITRTVYLDPLPSGSVTVNVSVPPFAKKVSIWRANPTLAPIGLTFFDANFNIRYTYSLPIDSGNGFTGYMFNSIPLDSSIVTIAVENSGAFDANASLIFELSL